MSAKKRTDKPNVFTSDSNQWRLLKPAARARRHAPTVAEDELWQALRAAKLGVRFRRQHAIGRFIVDFYCAAARLAIEVDGPDHLPQAAKDAVRDNDLLAQGIGVLRVTNAQVHSDLNEVITRISGILSLRLNEEAPLPGERGRAKRGGEVVSKAANART